MVLPFALPCLFLDVPPDVKLRHQLVIAETKNYGSWVSWPGQKGCQIKP